MRSRESLIGSLATNVRHLSIEWPCGLMAEVDTEWCRGLENGSIDSGYAGKPGLASGPTLPHRAHHEAKENGVTPKSWHN
jgi:hypothetical protein